MKQIVVLSGKGGTGKTFVSTSLMYIAKNECVAADCDVDAADVHLLLSPNILHKESFFSGVQATISIDKCSGCAKCVQVCHFGALSINSSSFPIIDSMLCEGCGYCSHICPTQAATLVSRNVGVIIESISRFGNPFVHARLNVGAQNSGKLVAEVKKRAIRITEETKNAFIIIDGSPGIGCPVISSVAGADYIILVAEPTISALHDLKRLLELVRKFHSSVGLILNKSDLHLEQAEKVKCFAKEENIPLLASIPYSLDVPAAISKKLTAVEYLPNIYEPIFAEIWMQIKGTLRGIL